jgi:hypothetical protein
VVSDSQRGDAVDSPCPAGWPTVDLTFKPNDETRTGDVVDVLVGNDFKPLATRTEFNASIAELAAVGRPTLPPRSCRPGNHPTAVDAPEN